MQSQIMRVNGPLNAINDTTIGGTSTFINSTTSSVSGQLGKFFDLDDSMLFFDSSIGTLYGGRFQYVRLAAAATAVVAGQIVFWDISVAHNLYQVTTSEAGSDPGAQFRAGIVLNPNWDAGNYSLIQTLGLVDVKFRAALSHAPTGIGAAAYAAGAGAGADNGLADILDSADPGTFGDMSLFQNRYLGTTKELAVNGGVTLVNLMPANWTP